MNTLKKVETLYRPKPFKLTTEKTVKIQFHWKKPLNMLTKNSVSLKKTTESYCKFGLNTDFWGIWNHWKSPLKDPIKDHWKVVCMNIMQLEDPDSETSEDSDNEVGEDTV